MEQPADFSFALVNPGSERAAKLELARVARELGAPDADLRPAYGRPGFITWKGLLSGQADALESRLVFVRLYARSLGKLAAPLDQRTPDEFGVAIDRVQVLARTPELEPHAHELIQALEASSAWVTRVSGRAPLRAGDRVLDLVVVGPDEYWLGIHTQASEGLAWFGGRLEVAQPDDAPSRAYAKLESVLDWAGLELEAGQRAAEVGSAPGGSAWALLTRGLHVVGIDPAQMDGRVLLHPRFTHLARSITVLEPERVPRDLDWVLVDVNAPPKLALAALETLLRRSSRTLRGAILTLKLRDARAEDEVWRCKASLTRLGFEDVRLRQLPEHHREVALVGTRRLG